MTEKEICKEIVRLGKCPTIFNINGLCFSGCKYCPFSSNKNNGLTCVNYTSRDNSKEVVKQAKEFLLNEKNMEDFEDDEEVPDPIGLAYMAGVEDEF